jgi:hypothetical protein
MSIPASYAAHALGGAALGAPLGAIFDHNDHLAGAKRGAILGAGGAIGLKGAAHITDKLVGGDSLTNFFLQSETVPLCMAAAARLLL